MPPEVGWSNTQALGYSRASLRRGQLDHWHGLSLHSRVNLSSTMIYRITLPLCALLVLMIGCGPSAADQRIQAEKVAAHEDSIKQAARAELEQQIATQKAYADTLHTMQNNVGELQSQLIEAKAELATAEDKLSRISQFQLGRTREERERQIHDATVQVEELRMRIPQLETALADEQARTSELASSGRAGKP